MNIIQELEREQIQTILAQRPVPEFGPGDTLKVMADFDTRKPHKLSWQTSNAYSGRTDQVCKDAHSV